MNVEEEIERLKTEIGRLGAKNDDGSVTVGSRFFICFVCGWWSFSCLVFSEDGFSLFFLSYILDRIICPHCSSVASVGEYW